MGKKLGSYRALSCTLAVLTTIAFIVACGEGKIEELVGSVDMLAAEDHAKIKSENVLENLPDLTLSSEGEGEQPVSSSNPEESSPSSQSSSSKEEPSSSSWFFPSSSSSEDLPPPPDYPYKVECKLKVSTGTQFVAIPPSDWPTVKCIEKATDKSVGNFDLNEDVKWTGEWSTSYWKTPPAGTYSVSVEVWNDAGVVECRKLKADCGTITITATSSSSRAYVPPSSSSAPSVTPSSNSATPSSSSRASSSSAASSGGTGQCTKSGSNVYCKWDDGKCNPIETNGGYVEKADAEKGIVACTAGNCTCENLIKNCDYFGYMYNNSNCSGTPIGQNTGNKGCCKWDSTNNNCWMVGNDTDWNKCPTKLPESACTPNNGTCH